MLNKANSRQELDRVNMFIRAISDEMADTLTHNAGDVNKVTLEMEEALFELRLRKLLISAMIDADLVAERSTSH